MGKLSLNAAPTFKAKVPIPVAGGEPVEVEMTFKHRDREAFGAWVKALDGKEKAKAFMEVVEAWELDDPYNDASVKLLLSQYMGAFQATIDKYMAELTQARLGN